MAKKIVLNSDNLSKIKYNFKNYRIYWILFPCNVIIINNRNNTI